MAEGAFLYAGYQIEIQRTLRKMKEVGAVSESTAKTPEDLHLDKKFLEGLVGKGIKKTSDGRFYVENKKDKHKDAKQCSS